MKVSFRNKEYEFEITDELVVFDNNCIAVKGVLTPDVKMTSEVNDDMLVTMLDKHAMAISISDKIDGYHAMNKADKIIAINENR